MQDSPTQFFCELITINNNKDIRNLYICNYDGDFMDENGKKSIGLD